MQNYMICPKADECETCGEPSHNKPHRYIKNCAFLSYNCPVCVPYRLRIGDRVRTPLGDVGEINELTYNNESAKVYKSGRLVTHCLLTDLEYLPPEFDTKTLNLADLPERLLCKSESKPEPTYRWTGKPLTWLDIANKSRADISDLFRILTWFANQRFILLKKENIVFSDKFINYATKHECFRQFLLEDGYIEDVKLEWLLG